MFRNGLRNMPWRHSGVSAEALLIRALPIGGMYAMPAILDFERVYNEQAWDTGDSYCKFYRLIVFFV